MKRTIMLAAIMAVGALSLAAAEYQSQAQPPSPKVVGLQKVKENLYVLTGGGGNTAVFVTDLGVVLVDTKLAGWGQPMLDKIKTVTPKPVVTVINTHSHADHVGGNEFFPTSVEIISHENARLSMEKMEAFRSGAKVNFLPKLMLKDKMTLGSGKDRIDLYYFGPGHTGGDIWVVFRGLRVMHAGDMLGAKDLPAVDGENGGSALMYWNTLAKAAAVKDVDTIITGHGPVMTMKDLQEYVQFNKDFRDAVVSGFNHGLGFSEIADGWKLPAKYAGYTASPDRIKANARTIFGELAK